MQFKKARQDRLNSMSFRAPRILYTFNPPHLQTWNVRLGIKLSFIVSTGPFLCFAQISSVSIISAFIFSNVFWDDAKKKITSPVLFQTTRISQLCKSWLLSFCLSRHLRKSYNRDFIFSRKSFQLREISLAPPLF